MKQHIAPNNNIWQQGEKSVYPRKFISEVKANVFFTVTTGWMVTYWNKTAETYLGIASADILGKRLRDSHQIGFPPEFSKLMTRPFQTSGPEYFEEYFGKIGNWSNVIFYHCGEAMSVSFKVDPGPLGVHDLQFELAALNELYQFVTLVTHDCLWEWNLLSGEIFWVDGGHKRIFGYQIENALIPESFWISLVHPDDRERVFAGITRLKGMQKDGLWEEEYRFKKADGEYIVVQDRGRVHCGVETGILRMIGSTQYLSELKATGADPAVRKSHELNGQGNTNLKQEMQIGAIASELQENLIQILGAAKLFVEIARTEKDYAEQSLKKSSGYIQTVMEEIREICKKLRRAGSSDGLPEKIWNLVHEINTKNLVQIEFFSDGIGRQDLDEQLQNDLFWIVRQQVENILLHSGAGWAIVNLTRSGDDVVLFISDDGKGCDASVLPTGSGILGMESRAAKYDRMISKRTSPGSGFELSVSLPLHSSAKENTLFTFVPDSRTGYGS